MSNITEAIVLFPPELLYPMAYVDLEDTPEDSDEFNDEIDRAFFDALNNQILDCEQHTFSSHYALGQHIFQKFEKWKGVYDPDGSIREELVAAVSNGIIEINIPDGSTRHDEDTLFRDKLYIPRDSDMFAVFIGAICVGVIAPSVNHLLEAESFSAFMIE